MTRTPLDTALEIIGNAPTDDLPSIIAEAIWIYANHRDNQGVAALQAALEARTSSDEAWILDEFSFSPI